VAAAIILEFDERVGRDQYDAVNAELGLDPDQGTGDWPKGLTTHVAGPTDSGGWIVAEVWDSKDDHAAWMGGRLGAALGAVGVPAPTRVTWIDLVAEHRP
jgi:hypothetical protein